MTSQYSEPPAPSSFYPPYGQNIRRVDVPGQAYHRDVASRYPQGIPVQALQPNMPPSMTPIQAQSNNIPGNGQVRDATSQSYEAHDLAFAKAGSSSRRESDNSPSQEYQTRIQPPHYASRSPDLAVANQANGGYPQVANGNQPYPTYTSQDPSIHHHPHQTSKLVPPAAEVGRGWAGFSLQDIRDLSPKARKRLIWVAILAVIILIILILFEVYKDDFERWVTPLRDWLREREAWSWTIPLAILLILSFPPLFGHEVVLLVVGLAFPIGVSIGIACAGAVLGEALVFLVFKYALSGRVRRKCEAKVSWAAVARVSQEAGFKGVMIIRYSIVPPRESSLVTSASWTLLISLASGHTDLANPIFATTGMTFFLYMISVILSLPKQIIFVVLGDPSSKGKTGAKIGKVIAVAVLVIVTLFGTRWIRKRLAIATKEIEAERNADVASKQRQQGLSVDNSAPLPPPEDLANMSPAERREWEQQIQMSREGQKKPEETNVYVRSS